MCLIMYVCLWHSDVSIALWLANAVLSADILMTDSDSAEISVENTWKCKTDWVVYRPTQPIIGHFGNKSFPAINYVGADNKKLTRWQTNWF